MQRSKMQYARHMGRATRGRTSAMNGAFHVCWLKACACSLLQKRGKFSNHRQKSLGVFLGVQQAETQGMERERRIASAAGAGGHQRGSLE
jgi:hypothetical protein